MAAFRKTLGALSSLGALTRLGATTPIKGVPLYRTIDGHLCIRCRWDNSDALWGEDYLYMRID